jgi:hypothetical protein
MKNYLLSPDGLTRIDDKDLARWQLQGSFMRSEGPVLFPVALGRPEADAVEALLARGENFVFWFTPDFRVVVSGKPNRWKVRFELRGMTRSGKAGVQTMIVGGKFESSKVVAVIAEVFERNRQNLPGAAPGPELSKLVEDAKDMSAERRALAAQAAASSAEREVLLAAMAPEDRERAIADWAHKLAGDVAHLTD